MNYNRLYSESLSKFGRAAPETVRTFVDASNATGNQDPNSHADLALADHLEDHGDPLHHIVKADLAIRGAEGHNWADKRVKVLESLLGTSQHALSHTSIGHKVNPHTDPAGKIMAHSIKTPEGKQVIDTAWSPNTSDGGMNYYEGFLQPEQFNEIAAEYGYPKTAEDLAKEEHI